MLLDELIIACLFGFTAKSQANIVAVTNFAEIGGLLEHEEQHY